MARRCCWPPRRLGPGRTGCVGLAACATREGWSAIGGGGGPTMPYGLLEAGGGSIGTLGRAAGGRGRWHGHQAGGTAAGYLRTGRRLELVTVDAGDRFPVNVYAGLCRGRAVTAL